MTNRTPLETYQALMDLACDVEERHGDEKMRRHLESGRDRSSFAKHPDNHLAHPITDKLVKVARRALSGGISHEEAMEASRTDEVNEALYGDVTIGMKL